MNERHYIGLSFLFFIVGAFFIAVHNDWIILRFPHKSLSNEHGAPCKKNISRQHITLYFFHHDQWHTEKIQLLISDDIAQNMHYITQAWLNLLNEENLMEKKVTVQDVLIAQTQCAYISFDRNPMSRDESTYEKYMRVEGLLETFRENGIKIQNVQLMVHHKPLQDYHLDFSHPWPLQGFLNE